MTLKTVLAAALVALPLAAYAHADKTGHNGGPQTDAGTFHVEVLPKGTALTVFVRDHDDKPVPTTGYKGTAIFVIGGKPERINLIPDGENRLKGSSTVTLPAQPKGAVQLTGPDGKTAQGRFN
jgi:hypothetical protein